MPETGPRAPARTFVAVRAIVPVTQMPPNSADADIGDALGDQLAIRAVPPPGHAVGDHGGEQRLDGAEQREREGGRQHCDDLGGVEIGGSAGAGKALGMPPKRVPIVSTGRREGPARHGREADRDQKPGQCGAVAARKQDGSDRDRGDRGGGRVDGPGSAHKRCELRQEAAGLLAGKLEAEQVARAGSRR